MAYITKQELQSSGKWWTWINTEGYNTIIQETSYQMDETEATSIREIYLDQHLYDNVYKMTVDVYEHRDIIVNTVTFIKTENPNLSQWNNYLASLSWHDALMVRWFLAVLAQKLAERAEVSLDAFTETEVLAKLKTFIINSPPRRLRKILFGD